MVQVPLTHRYLLFERAYAPSEGLGEIKPTACTLDLDTGEAVVFNPLYNPGCSGPLILEDGHIVVFGGDEASAVRNMSDGRNAIRLYEPSNTSLVRVSQLQSNRWYPTPIRTFDGKVLVVGGTVNNNVGPTPSFAELWDPKAPATPTSNVSLPPTFAAAALPALNWYPTMLLLWGGEIVWFGNKGGAITDRSFNVILDLPPWPVGYSTMYPLTASVAVLAYKPPDYCARFVLFGGSYNRSISVPTASTSVRLDICYCSTHPTGICVGAWQVADMLGIERVMGDATVLPTGKVFVNGGARRGEAGLGLSTVKANAIALVYDPEKPTGEQYARFGFGPIPRVYHAAACLDINGKILLAGCETCGRWQQLEPGSSLTPDPSGRLEYRLEFAVPREIGLGSLRPVILSAPATLVPDTVFQVAFQYDGGALIGASLVAPCASTHSINMNGRVITLQVVPTSPASDGVVQLAAPPAALFGHALYGTYLLFLLGQDESYSEGVWVTLARRP